MAGSGIGRRAALRAGAGVFAGGVLAAPMVHAQGTGGTLRCGWWDHWVPAGNGIMRELCKEWGDRNRVEVQIDFITSVGNQNLLTIAAQAQSRSGHDILAFPTWQPSAYARLLEPVDDVIGRLVQKYGPIDPAAEYLGKREGAWRGVPAVSGTPDQAALHPLRPDAAARRDRRPGDVAGQGGARPGRRHLELGHLPHRGREVPRGRASPSACPWASSPTPWTGWARCSAPSAPAWWTRKARSRSATTRRCGRPWTTWCGCRNSCRAMSGPGTTPPTIAG